MSRDLHRKPFDEGTLVKLSLIKDYVREWLPVFLAKANPYWKQINIFDFFAGPGKTEHGDKGTPLLLVDELKAYGDKIAKERLAVTLYLNEFDRGKFHRLCGNITAPDFIKLETENLDFHEAFKRYYPRMKGSANLLLLDQSGIKQIDESVMKKIIALPTTDFLMFISSSTIRRFAEHPNISKYIRIPKNELTSRDYYDIHRMVTQYFNTFVPEGAKYYMAPFSIKKGSNIYGLIFGTHNLLGLKKFLRACWKTDPARGEANFDIDDDRINALQPSLFSEMDKPKKVTMFERELEKRIVDGKLTSKAQVEEFVLCSGFLPKHASNVVRKLKKSVKTIESL